MAVQPTLQMRNVWTVEDLQALDLEDWRRYEAVDGTLVVSPSAGREHEFVSEALRAAIRRALPDLVAVIGPIGVEIGRSYLIPDLVVVDAAARSGSGPLRPDEVLLVIEVVSPGSESMDRILKPAKYAAAGIAAHWRVETDPVSLTAYELRAGETAYTEVGTWNRGEIARLDQPFPVEVEIDNLGA